MKIAAIKQAVENYSIEALEKAENDLLNESPLDIEIGGADEGEKLTHIIAAKEVLKEVATGVEPKQAIRNYTQRVRTSIS